MCADPTTSQAEEEFEDEEDQEEVDDEEMVEAHFDEIEKLEQMGITATDVAKVWLDPLDYKRPIL